MKKLCFVLLTFIASLNAIANDTKPSPVDVTELQALRNESGLPFIQGVVTNHSPDLLKNVIVKFNLYDQQGNLVGNALDIVSDLGPGDRWVFHTHNTKEFYSFKMTSVDTYTR